MCFQWIDFSATTISTRIDSIKGLSVVLPFQWQRPSHWLKTGQQLIDMFYRCILRAWLVSQLEFGTRRPYLRINNNNNENNVTWLVSGGGRYSDNRYSDISKWVMQWVRVLGIGLGLRLQLGLELVLGTVGIGSVGIGTCTHSSQPITAQISDQLSPADYIYPNYCTLCIWA